MRLATGVFSLGFLLTTGVALAADTTLELSIKDHKFTPAELHAPANTPIIITVKNLDATPEEFESKPLKAEKVIAAGGTGQIKVRALAPGRYPFVGEFHEDSAKGVLIVE